MITYDGIGNDRLLLNISEEQRNITDSYARSRGRDGRINARILNMERRRRKYNNRPSFRFGIWNSEVLSIMTHVYT